MTFTCCNASQHNLIHTNQTHSNTLKTHQVTNKSHLTVHNITLCMNIRGETQTSNLTSRYRIPRSTSWGSSPSAAEAKRAELELCWCCFCRCCSKRIWFCCCGCGYWCEDCIWWNCYYLLYYRYLCRKMRVGCDSSRGHQTKTPSTHKSAAATPLCAPHSVPRIYLFFHSHLRYFGHSHKSPL